MLIPLFISLIAGLSTVLGSVFIFIKIKDINRDKFIVFCLSLSLSIMLMISISELIPESIIYISINNNFIRSLLIIVITFMSGVLIVKLLITKLDKIHSNSLLKLGILNMIVLMLHNIPEGMATYISSYKDLELGIKLAISIIMHNIPEGIAIAVPIYYETKSRFKAIVMTLISGLSELLGALIVIILFNGMMSYMLLSVILLLVGGIMVSLAINKIYPEVLKYKMNGITCIGIVCGVFLVIVLHYLFV